MGISIEFFLGDTDKIVNAIRQIEFEKLDDPTIVQQAVDFSLHVSEHDLDLLSQEFGVISGKQPMGLASHLRPLFEDDGVGVSSIDSEWILYAAEVPPESVQKATDTWFGRMRQEYRDEEIKVTDEAVEAVNELLGICKRAKAENRPILFHWCL